MHGVPRAFLCDAAAPPLPPLRQGAVRQLLGVARRHRGLVRRQGGARLQAVLREGADEVDRAPDDRPPRVVLVLRRRRRRRPAHGPTLAHGAAVGARQAHVAPRGARGAGDDSARRLAEQKGRRWRRRLDAQLGQGRAAQLEEAVGRPHRQAVCLVVRQARPRHARAQGLARPAGRTGDCWQGRRPLLGADEHAEPRAAGGGRGRRRRVDQSAAADGQPGAAAL
mmetsp:Transcript_4142/g.12346  ORF Transcript_4142/g.12346 Transcript_4142/m.12346 type:complete len:224 (-) Transcript_4142:509-1180(-)